ncbi:MAG: hypothetical protein PHY47_27300 [Lachnospiraceae bacterium]|nr:hypothetical protein [Lachnospiraceae bacterium]
MCILNNNKNIKTYIAMMNMKTRNEYLKEIRRDHLKASKKGKGVILSEVRKITK